MVVFAVLIVLTLVVLALFLPGTFGRREEPGPEPAGRQELAAVEPDSDDERAEELLVRMLVSGSLPVGEYQRGMAVLAAHDAVRHPLVVPPER